MCWVFAREVLSVLETPREPSELGLLMDVQQEGRPPPPPARELEACAQLPSSCASVGVRFRLHCYFAVKREGVMPGSLARCVFGNADVWLIIMG